jgi:uncharacterized protein (TIGR03083 family)
MYLSKLHPTRLEHNSMALSRTDVSDGLVNALHDFEALVRSLSSTDLDAPSRCDDWTVGDVARHVIGSMADVVAGRLDGLGTPEVTAREVAERQGRSAGELADECAEAAKASAGLLGIFDDAAWSAPAGGGFDGTLGQGVEALWYDTWLHADDIRSALGRPTEIGNGMTVALSHVEDELKKLDWAGNIPAVDDPAAFAFVLAATGRGDATSLGANAPINLYAA